MTGKCPFSRRNFLTAAGSIAALAGAAGFGGRYAMENLAEKKGINLGNAEKATVPFLGEHQGGITTSAQNHIYFAAFDLIAEKREAVVKMLQDWTDAAAKMTGGKMLQNDSQDTLGIGASQLTLTFGFGPGLFIKNGSDRYSLATKRPEALVDLPKFNGDQLIPEKTGGDISVQACADDPETVFHAIRQLTRIASGIAVLRWTQTGFISKPEAGKTPRNLMGFKDGTESPANKRPKQDNPEAAKNNRKKGLEEVVWVGNEGPDWMQGGSYLVVRRIRMALEHWDDSEVDFQEQVIGRQKLSGAPLGGKEEFDELNLDATDKDGNFIIPENAHVRLAAAASNNGAQILRRGYSYNDGINFTAERWPPWRQGLEYDAGLLFLAYQRDPRTGFIKIFENMSKLDAMNQFVTHTGSGLFACPGGMGKGEFIGEKLFSV